MRAFADDVVELAESLSFRVQVCEISFMSLVVRPSAIDSVGVFTTKPIRKGTRVVEYDGERITPEEADRRYDGAVRTYLYELDGGKTIIDGHGLGAFLNHSCDPNCEPEETRGRVWLFAIRNIAAGEELVWDYNLRGDEEPAPCHCGSPKCRGTMYSKEWTTTLRRRAARKKKTGDQNGRQQKKQRAKSRPHNVTEPQPKTFNHRGHEGEPKSFSR